MFRNYLKIAIRNISSAKLYSTINISGLAIGISVCFIISLWVQHEISYDNFHHQAENIFRVERRWDYQEMHGQGANTSGPFGPVMVKDYPEISNFVRLRKTELYIKDQRNIYHKQKIYLADNNIFEFFDFNLSKGNKKSALAKPYSVVLSAENAAKYIGGLDVIGKSVTIDWEGEATDFLITGVLDKTPSNSHIQFDILVSLNSYPDNYLSPWLNNSFYTYILLKDGVSGEQLESKFPTFLNKYMTDEFRAFFSPEITVNDVFKIKLKPILDIHLDPTRNFEIEPQGNKTSVYIFSMIAFLILLIACINFINLSTARVNRRASEVGIRKSIGANSFQLSLQFLGESLLMAFMALLLSLFLIEAMIPFFNTLSGKNFSGDMILHINNLISLILIALISGLLAGIYPAIHMASINPIKALQGIRSKGKGKLKFLRTMAVFQYSVSIALIISTIIIFRQMNYIQEKALGFDKDNLVIISAKSNTVKQNIQAFRTELLKHTDVVSVSFSSNIPGNQFFGDTNFRRDDNDQFYNLLLLQTSHDFKDTYGLQLITGRYFSRDFITDYKNAFVINKKAVKTLGLEPDEALGKKLIMTLNAKETRAGKIIGVVEDFHFQSLHRRIEPLVLYLDNMEEIQALSVKILPENMNNVIEFLEQKWLDFFPGEEFEYSFLDNRLAMNYQSERKLHKLFITFAFLSIFIAILGLFGLAVFTAEERKKEIGVRKVLGSSVSGIVLLLSTEYSRWVLLANFIAWPVAWMIMDNWLQNFAFKISIDIWEFVIAGVFTVLIALMTVSTQAFKAAITNPATSLKYE